MSISDGPYHMDHMTRGSSVRGTDHIGTIGLMKYFYSIKLDPNGNLEPSKFQFQQFFTFLTPSLHQVVIGISTPRYDP